MQLPKHILYPNPDIYLSDSYVVLDFEVTNKDKGDPNNPDNMLVCGVWWYNGRYKSVVGDEYAYGELLDDIESADFIAAHHAKFELGWLVRCGLDIANVVVYDTLLGEYILAGNRKWPLDLQSVAKRYGLPGKDNLVSSLIKGGVCPSEIPIHWLLYYNKIDVKECHDVFKQQRRVLQYNKQLPLQYTRCLFTPVLTDIETRGLQLDKDRVNTIHARLTDEYLQLMQKIDEFTGGINTRSSKQRGEFLYDTLKFDELRDHRGRIKKTPKGARLTDAATILSLTCKNKRQEEFIDLMHKQSWYEAKLTKSITKFQKCIQDDGGVLYASFNQSRTTTHRLSSTGKKYGVQLQNMDREMKPLFKAKKEGWKITEVDYAQLEWRGAAYLSQDPVAIKSIMDNHDVHSYTAQVLYQNELTELHGSLPTLDEIKTQYGDYRQKAKPDTFAPLYGAEYGTPEQVRYYQEFRKKYPTIATTQLDWVHTVMTHGHITTATGLKFYWPNVKVDRWGKIPSRIKNQIYNYNIQSFSTVDIVPIGIIFLWHALRANNYQSYIINTIHDSVILETHPEEIETVAELSGKCMVKHTISYLAKVYDVHINIPLEIETKTSDFWADSQTWQDKWLNNERTANEQ